MTKSGQSWARWAGARHAAKASVLLLASVVSWLVLAPGARAGVVFTTLHSFNGTNGAVPEATLVEGRDGWLYGTTLAGGTNDAEIGGRGTVFRISTNGEFGTLVNLAYPTGSNPQSGLLQAEDGCFYSVSDYGGEVGAGVVYRLSPTGVFTTVCSLDWTNGGYPHGLTDGADGWFYGTAIHGGADVGSVGTVFKVSTNGDLVTLASFHGADGAHPQAPLLRAADGNFYGTTVDGGHSGKWGTLFRITPTGALTTLVSFAGGNGAHPMSALVQDMDGNIYGTTLAGGLGFANSPYTGNGTVFKYSPQGEFSTLHFFKGYPDDGSQPSFAGFCLGLNGEWIGTTERGGSHGSGAIYALASNGDTRLLYSFSERDYASGVNSDGAEPAAGLVRATDGCFYGVAMSGGQYGLGTIFRFSFVPDPPVISIVRRESVLELMWPTVQGSNYQLQSNEGLIAINWLDEGLPISATNTAIRTSVSIGPERARFFRVVRLD